MSKKYTFRSFLATLGSYPEVVNAIVEASLSMEEINDDCLSFKEEEKGIPNSPFAETKDNSEDIRKFTMKLFKLMNAEWHLKQNDGTWDSGINIQSLEYFNRYGKEI